MIRKIISIFFVSVFILFGSFSFMVYPAYGEVIESFITNISVNIDNSINVTENIVYDTQGSEHHGIYRHIYNSSSQDRKMEFGSVSVTDENGQAYIFTTSRSGSTFEIKIGDPEVTFKGKKTYIIKYRVNRAVAQLKDVDEIYWNTTGNEWNMPINKTEAIVVLPNGVKSTRAACYWGVFGSTDQCLVNKLSEGVYEFSLENKLDPQEGLTVAVGFEKGMITPYTFFDDLSDFFLKYLIWLIAALLPIITLIFSLRYWYEHGRDPKGTGVIVAQYDVPDNLTPMEVSGIVNEKVNSSHVSAEIIYLATKGYLKINQLEEKFIGLIKTVDYELVKLKDYSDVAPFDKALLRGLFYHKSPSSIAWKQFKNNFKTKTPKFVSFLDSFVKNEDTDKINETGDKNRSVKISDLKYEFNDTTQDVITKVINSLLSNKYYSNLGRVKTGPARWFLILFLAVWASGFLGIIIGLVFLNGNPFPVIISIFSSIIIYGVVSHFYPAKTVKGVAITEYLQGLKRYLSIAEKNRLEFHNAPEKKPEVFEKLLPYAMVLGVSEIWAKEFEGIYTTPPSWYSGTPGTTFNAIAFSHTISNFSSFAGSSLSATHNGGGGSGGGGSSGGGGGGGGGGSW